MAKYESENGSIQLSQNNFNLLFSLLKNAYNNDVDKSYELALQIHAYLKNNKISFNFDTFLYVHMQSATHKIPEYKLTEKDEILVESFRSLEIFQKLIFEELLRTKENWNIPQKHKIFKPRKKSFTKLSNNNKNFVFEIGHYGTLSLCSKTNTVNWDIEYGNHYVDDAKLTTYGSIFHDFLRNSTLSKNEIYSVEYQNEYENFV